jgi:hypothetical protein
MTKATAYVPYDGPRVTRAEAKAAGEPLFFTGMECRRGHLAQRYVAQGLCVECAKNAAQRQRDDNPLGCAAQVDVWRKANKDKVKAWAQTWVRPNPEARKAYEKAYREANKEKITARTMEWRAANRERWDEAARVWQKANREHVASLRAAWHRANADHRRITSKVWRQENAEKIKAVKKAWLAANKLRTRVYVENRRVRKLANGGSHTAEQIEALYIRQRERCAGCNKSIRKYYEIDHIIPITRGGSNNISNIQLLCLPCNRTKHNKPPEKWAREQGRLL